MEQDIFQVFFDVIEVLGIGVIDNQTQLELYLKDHNLDANKNQEIAHDILQSITNKHEEFDFCEFPVMSYYAYTYKLNHNLHILILTHALVTRQLKDTLQKDIEVAMMQFKILSQDIPRFSTEIKVTTEELLNTLNQVSHFISKYMGTKLTANYWELSRPQFEWLKNFQINHSAKITFSTINKKPVSALHHQWVKQWASAFIKRCAQTIKDLPALIEEKCLDENQKNILLDYSASSLSKLEDGIVVRLSNL